MIYIAPKSEWTESGRKKYVYALSIVTKIDDLGWPLSEIQGHWFLKCCKNGKTLRYRDHIGSNSAKIISRLISLTISLSCKPQHDGSTPKETPPNFNRNRSGIGKIVDFRRLSRRISRKRCKIGSKLLLNTNMNMYTRFRLVPESMTLDDLWARFKVIDSLNAAKMAKCSLVITPTPCTVAGCIISIRPMYQCAGLLTYLHN